MSIVNPPASIASRRAGRQQQSLSTCLSAAARNTIARNPAVSMAPSIPAAPWRSRPNTTRVATTLTTLARSFTTTPVRREVEIPPESPRFIPLPELPQSSEVKRPYPKGHLPVPREIFTKRANMAHKLQPSFVEDTAPRSKAELAGLPPKSEKDEWKRTIAESRRQALGTGVQNLWKRKVTRDAKAKKRADTKQAQHLADKFRPERLDEVYTRGTLTQATLSCTVVRDPEYKEKQLESQERTAAMHRTNTEARKDAVQRLYVEAGRFILTESELQAMIEKKFSDQYLHVLAKSNSKAWWGAKNMWEAIGKPLSTATMFNSTTNIGKRSDDYSSSSQKKTDQRQRIIAGELTGGALSITGIVDVESINKAAQSDEVVDDVDDPKF